jgi:hypothetical protein
MQGFALLQDDRSIVMRYIFISTLLVSVGLTSPAFAASYDCTVAVQNWKNGSLTTCPYDSGVQAPAIVAPVVEIPVEIPYTECSSLSQDILPPVLRKHSVSDFAGNLKAPDGCDK